MKLIRFVLLLIVMFCFAIIFCILLARILSKETLIEDLHLLERPLSYLTIVTADNVVVENATVVLENNTNVYYLEAKSPPEVEYRGNLLYLHGAAYSSHDWNRNKPSILQLSAAAGYRTVAIDLPGFGYSRTQSSASFNKSAFMSSVIKKLNIHKPIIISPSASGSYAIPYVLKNADRIGGFIPVAPCCVRSTGWEQFKVPTLVVYGSDDKALISPGLLKIPNRKLIIIPNAPHAAYIRKPIDFITVLINFLYSISSS